VLIKMFDYEPYLGGIGKQRDSMVELLLLWADTNSESHNLSGLSKMISLLEDAFSVLEAEAERIDLIAAAGSSVPQAPLGQALRIRKRGAAPVRVFLGCHMDTVYRLDHPFQKCEMTDDNTLRGPGVTDAKGGLVVLLKALEAFEKSPWAENLGWELLINPDEEIGSPGSGALLVEAARNNHLGLVFEPSLPDGNLVGDRKGSGNYVVTVRGRAAHAGREPHMGRNAVSTLARFIVELNKASENGVTINVGYIEGGGPVNVVPDLAVCRFNVRVMTPEDQTYFEEHVDGLVREFNRLDGIALEIEGRFARPPKPLDGKTLQLLAHIAQCGSDLGLNLEWRASGGSCDGNNLAAAGLTTVDSLGVTGGGIHSAEEYVMLDSLTERARLTAMLLMKLGAGEMKLEELDQDWRGTVFV
jgi:glutamate carboxypeptidase